MLFVVTADEPLTYEVWRQGIMRPGLCDCEWLVLDNSRLRAGGQHFDSSGLPHRHNILEFIGSELVSLYRTLSYLLDNFASLFPESPVEDVSICFIEYIDIRSLPCGIPTCDWAAFRFNSLSCVECKGKSSGIWIR